MQAFKRTKLQNIVTILGTRIDKRMYLQMHLFGVMLHSGPVRLGKEWGSPSEIKVIFTGIDATGVFEICAEYAC